MGKKKGGKTVEHFRDADNGRFLTEKEAQRRPKNEVVKERVPKPGYGDTK